MKEDVDGLSLSFFSGERCQPKSICTNNRCFLFTEYGQDMLY